MQAHSASLSYSLCDLLAAWRDTLMIARCLERDRYQAWMGCKSQSGIRLSARWMRADPPAGINLSGQDSWAGDRQPNRSPF